MLLRLLLQDDIARDGAKRRPITHNMKSRKLQFSRLLSISDRQDKPYVTLIERNKQKLFPIWISQESETQERTTFSMKEIRFAESNVV